MGKKVCFWRILFVTMCLFFSSLATAFATNVAVSGLSVAAADGSHNRAVQFTATWDNSWRVSGAPSLTANWDAVWVFAKFRKNSGAGWSPWGHCTLLNTGNTVPAGATMDFGITGAAYKGVFLYRSSAGSGSNTFSNGVVQWAAGTDGVADGDFVDVKVFAIEMVYVPQGSFYVGDPSQTGTDPFYSYGCTAPNCSYQITAESAITVGTSAGNLYYTNSGNGGDRGTPIPANFPKGYNAFYIMKDEVSQRQYAEFLNTLTVSQQSQRWITGNFNNTHYYIKKAANGQFGTDANNNAGADGSANYANMNEAADGGWTACNFLSIGDLYAYADWAALRPFTELEFEKAARGGQPPVAGEYAWGNTTLETCVTSLTSGGTSSEVPNQGNVNVSGCGLGYPFRVGSFARSGSTRQNAGAGYYGALDLSGNLWERPVTVGNATGRGFTGSHGDGVLSGTGDANNADWPPGSTATGSGYRGGAWSSASTYATTADRYYAAHSSSGRSSDNGGRLARTFP